MLKTKAWLTSRVTSIAAAVLLILVPIRHCWFCFRCVLTVLRVWANGAMRSQRSFASSAPRSFAPSTPTGWTAISDSLRTLAWLWWPRTQQVAGPAFRLRAWCLGTGAPAWVWCLITKPWSYGEPACCPCTWCWGGAVWGQASPYPRWECPRRHRPLMSRHRLGGRAAPKMEGGTFCRFQSGDTRS